MRTTLSIAAMLSFAAALGAQAAPAHTVTCNDGTTDISTHKGACGKHGGIKPAPAAVVVNAPPPKGAVKVNTPGGTPTAAPMATKTAPVGVVAPPPAAAPNAANKLVPPASAPAGIIGPSDNHAASPRDPGTGTHSSPRDATVTTKLDHATAKCKDGMYSHSTNTQLQCAGHQGVGTHLGAGTSH